MSSPSTAGTQRRPLGQTLIERGVLTEDQLRIALLEQKARGIPLGKVLVTLGFLTEATLREALAENLGHREIDLSRVVPNPAALALVPGEFAQRHRVFPVSVDDETRQLTLALANPNDVMLIDQLTAMLGGSYKLQICLAAEGDIANAITLHYGHELSIDGILNEIETGEIDAISLEAAGREYSGPVVRLVDSILADAIRRRASDIHFEPEAGFVRIRYRIDGVLRQIRALHAKFWPPMSVRLKIVSGMNIAESRAPQDGRVSLIMNGRTVDFRAAAQPTIHGENFVFRVLDRGASLVTLEQMNLSEEHLATLEMMLARPEGIILVTGPTGSGKTTTLYSILMRLNKESVNIMTLEDPVEYPLPMVRQSNLASGIKMEFASGIRSLMRQDPDIILVGEVRDADTATMALRAAMTGHQVYSTLHTNSAIGAIPRLIDLGLTPELMAGNLIGIIGQRLVRKLCPHCKVPFEADDETALALGMPADGPRTLYRAEGCLRCEYQGYRGRMALQEILCLDEELDDLIARHASTRDILKTARQKGYRTLADDAVRRIIAGSTSIEEAGRVVNLTSLGARLPDAHAGAA
ncbi:MAG TPA: ATPase, T2SS/T4P/T4SS family [Burkholderiaceae bacterium]|nr:ATPase, T2SS/T4P/T4SS family [Burkholderiaceae bacterium]